MTPHTQSDTDTWVHVEKYLYGSAVNRVEETKSNVLFELENGAVLTINIPTQDLLEKVGAVHLHRPIQLHVTADENLLTGELRNLHLLDLEDHQPGYDRDEFKLTVERGTKAWSGTPDAAAWLETLRGHRKHLCSIARNQLFI